MDKYYAKNLTFDQAKAQYAIDNADEMKTMGYEGKPAKFYFEKGKELLDTTGKQCYRWRSETVPTKENIEAFKKLSRWLG